MPLLFANPRRQVSHDKAQNMFFTTMRHLTSVDSDEPVQPPLKLRELQIMFSQRLVKALRIRAV